MADPMASNDLPSMHYEQLSDQEIDDKINENFTYIVENLKVNELLHGRHNFDKIIPDTVLSELRIFDPNRKLRQAKLFLTEYLKSKDKGKGQVFKNALLNSDNKTVRDVFSSNTTELDQAAHSNEGYALDNFRSAILDQLECDVHLVETCYSRRLINDTEKQEIEAGRDHHGSWYGITKLLDCVKKTHHGYSTFLDVLYDIGQRVLMRDLDAEKYDKRKAKDQDGGNEQCHYTEFNESPALSLELHQGNSRPAESVKSLHQLNIPLENNLGDGPVSSRTRSKTKLQETASEGSGEFLVTATIAVQRKKSGKPVDVVPGSLSVPKASTEPDSTSDEENSREKRTIGFHSPGTLKYLPHDKTRKNVTSQKTINDVIKPPKQDHDSASQTEAIRKSFKFFEDSDKNSNMSREIREINKALKAVNIQDITGCRSSPSVTEEMTHRQADNFSSAIGGTSHTKSHGKCSESFTEIEPLKSYSTNRMMEDTEPKQTEKRRFGFQSRNTLKFSNSSKIRTLTESRDSKNSSEHGVTQETCPIEKEIYNSSSSEQSVLREINSQRQADTKSSDNVKSRPKIIRCKCGKPFSKEGSFRTHLANCSAENGSDSKDDTKPNQREQQVDDFQSPGHGRCYEKSITAGGRKTQQFSKSENASHDIRELPKTFEDRDRTSLISDEVKKRTEGVKPAISEGQREIKLSGSTSHCVPPNTETIKSHTEGGISDSVPERPRVFRCKCGKKYKDRESLNRHSAKCGVEDLRNSKPGIEPKQTEQRAHPAQGKESSVNGEDFRKSENVSDDRRRASKISGENGEKAEGAKAARSEEMKTKKMSPSVSEEQIQRSKSSVDTDSRLVRPRVFRCKCGKTYKDRESLNSHMEKCSY